MNCEVCNPGSHGARVSDRFFCPGDCGMHDFLKNASSLFCVGRMNRHTSSVTHTRRRGLLTELIPNRSVLTVNQPRGIFRAAAWASHMGGAGADSGHTMYPFHQSFQHPVEKSQKSEFFSIQKKSGYRRSTVPPASAPVPLKTRGDSTDLRPPARWIHFLSTRQKTVPPARHLSSHHRTCWNNRPRT